jgi:hypothetical protein
MGQGTGDSPGSRAASEGGPKGDVDPSKSGFVNLPPRDRAALQQSQAEKYPQEYGPIIEQYLRNLSDPEKRQ